MKHVSRLAPALATVLLAGCMAQGDFPSLAQRDVEREPLTEPVRAVPVVADDPALRSTIAGLLTSATQSNRDFDSAFGAADRAARLAGAPASDSWVAAQEQVSRVEAARAGTMRSLADLDRLALERSNLPTSPGDQAALDEAMAQVQRLADAQQSRLDRLKTAIAR